MCMRGPICEAGARVSALTPALAVVLLEGGDGTGLPLSQPALALSMLARRLETRMGGSSGALYSIFLEAAASRLRNGSVPVGLACAVAKGRGRARSVVSRALGGIDAYVGPVHPAPRSVGRPQTMRVTTGLRPSKACRGRGRWRAACAQSRSLVALREAIGPCWTPCYPPLRSSRMPSAPMPSRPSGCGPAQLAAVPGGRAGSAWADAVLGTRSLWGVGGPIGRSHPPRASDGATSVWSAGRGVSRQAVDGRSPVPRRTGYKRPLCLSDCRVTEAGCRRRASGYRLSAHHWQAASAAMVPGPPGRFRRLGDEHAGEVI